MKHQLEFDGIRLSFRDRVILSDIYLKVETGAVTGLLGRNGQGKTCLFKIVYGVLSAQERSIRFDKRPVSTPCDRPDLIRYLPQFDFIPRRLSVARAFDDFEIDFHPFEKRFPEFSSRYKSKIADLSGGESRFIHTYLILRSATQFVILDEPFTHLMPLQIEKIIELIQEEKTNKGLLITDHLYGHVLNLSDDLYLLSDGKTHRVNEAKDLDRLGYARS